MTCVPAGYRARQAIVVVLSESLVRMMMALGTFHRFSSRTPDLIGSDLMQLVYLDARTS